MIVLSVGGLLAALWLALLIPTLAFVLRAHVSETLLGERTPSWLGLPEMIN